MRVHVISHLFQYLPKKFTPKQISDSIEMKNDSVRRVCLELDELGFVKKTKKSEYSVSIKQVCEFIIWSKHQQKVQKLNRSIRKYT
jgi:DNA-binding IclR family transcriptional regulator